MGILTEEKVAIDRVMEVGKGELFPKISLFSKTLDRKKVLEYQWNIRIFVSMTKMKYIFGTMAAVAVMGLSSCATTGADASCCGSEGKCCKTECESSCSKEKSCCGKCKAK